MASTSKQLRVTVLVVMAISTIITYCMPQSSMLSKSSILGKKKPEKYLSMMSLSESLNSIFQNTV